MTLRHRVCNDLGRELTPLTPARVNLISPPAGSRQGLGIYPQQVNWLTASDQECRPKREFARPLWTVKCGPQNVGMACRVFGSLSGVNQSEPQGNECVI